MIRRAINIGLTAVVVAVPPLLEIALVIAFIGVMAVAFFGLLQSFRRFAYRCSMAGLSPAPGVWLRQLTESEQDQLFLLAMGTVWIPVVMGIVSGVCWVLVTLLHLVGVA